MPSGGGPPRRPPRPGGDAGATRAYLQVLDLHDLDHLALVAEAVLPHTG